MYEACFSGFEAHRILVGEHGIRNIVINPAIPTSNKERKRHDHGTYDDVFYSLSCLAKVATKPPVHARELFVSKRPPNENIQE